VGAGADAGAPPCARALTSPARRSHYTTRRMLAPRRLLINRTPRRALQVHLRPSPPPPPPHCHYIFFIISLCF